MRISGFSGTHNPNSRPRLVISADAYIRVQGESSVRGCGECDRKININDYLTGFSTDASIDSAPGSSTIQLSIPQTSVNDFYVENQFVIIPMMEIEIYSRGYYTSSGTPQYYRVFWGIVSSVTENWSDGVSTVSISCKDILRWWELTSLTTNPAYLEAFGSSAGNYQLFQNQFSRMNHYAVIASLAKDAMGDFLQTTNSFQQFLPERGEENPVLASYAADMMAYWQLKFSNIGASLLMYGSSGESYSISNIPGSVDAQQISKAILEDEARKYKENEATQQIFNNPNEIVAFKQNISSAGDVEFMQAEQMSKLAIAMQAREQAGYEFFCDPSGDIVYKPPFFNLNVLPNKPVSWIQDFEILDYSISENEESVITHATSSGNAFGGATDWGLNDEITTPRAGAYDFHLLRRYGWRRADLQLEWAGNPRKMFYHLLDWMDKINAKRNRATITIPMRPELRMGFPIWIPRFDSFYYIEGISHQYSVGGEATTSLTLSAKRSKFIAPKNIGEIRQIQSSSESAVTTPGDKGNQTSKPKISYSVSFPDEKGSSSGQSGPNSSSNGPAYIRDPKTGKLLGCPNVVMVYKAAYSSKTLSKLSKAQGSVRSSNSGKKDKNSSQGQAFTYKQVVQKTKQSIDNDQKAKIIAQLRAHRYEAGMTNAGGYDYAVDRTRTFKELQMIPVGNIEFGAGTSPEQDISISDDGQFVLGTRSSGAEQAATGITEKSIRDKEKALSDYNSKISELERQFRTTSDQVEKDKKNSSQSSSLFDDPIGYISEAASNLLDIQGRLDSMRQQARAQAQAIEDMKRVFYSTSNGSKLADLNCMIRPVSDEFGFEVIGHYRYGRGAFIDRNGIQVRSPDTGRIVNQLNIPFSPSGGLLTSNPSYSSNLDPSAQSFASMFESMRPDDYVTGASFKRTSGSESNVELDAFTGLSSYDSDIENAASTAVFVDADSRRKSKTLAELSPQTSNGLDSVSYGNCACSLSKTDWWSVLPQSEIQKVINFTSTASVAASSTLTSDSSVGLNGILQSVPQDPQVLFSDRTGKTFFEVLRDYLKSDFISKYVENQARENLYTGDGLIAERDSGLDSNRGLEQDNLLNNPGSPLFNRAASGDPDALAALQNEANFNFGLTRGSISEFKSTVNNSATRIQDQFENFNPAGYAEPNNPISIESGPVQKGYQVPAYSSYKDPVNPTYFDSAAKAGEDPSRLQSDIVPDNES